MPDYELRFSVNSGDETAVRQLAEALSEAFERAKITSTQPHITDTLIVRYTLVKMKEKK